MTKADSQVIFSNFILNSFHPAMWSLLVLVFFVGCGDEQPNYHEWSVYKGDITSSSYSALEQINKENVEQLEVAWTYRTGDLTGEEKRATIECNPIVVDGVMYGTSPLLKAFAIDAKTGEEQWIFDPFEGVRASGVSRGVVYWEDGPDRRILFSAGDVLYALDAGTGELIDDFGSQGKVDLNLGLGRDPSTISVKAYSPGIVYENLLILGSRVGEAYGSAPGHVRAYDIRTGEIAWTFHTIPQPGQLGYDTWENAGTESYGEMGGANAWAGMSLDRERGLVFIPTGAPAYDYYGGNRKGKNLFANSIVALDAGSGEYIWHFQTVHHDLWDYDLPAPPNLVTIEKEGQMVDAVAQVSKTGFTYVLNRETGEPLFPIEEKAVPSSNVPGEEAWPTQPFPQKPEPFIRQHLSGDVIAGRTPQIRDFVVKKLENLRNEGLFTPPDPKGTVLLPGSRGGANWGGAAHDPTTGVLYINANESPEIGTVKEVGSGSSRDNTIYERGENLYTLNCATCHGMDHEGVPPTYPPLADIKEQMTKKEIRTVIREGGAMMPAFKTISDEEIEAIITFLFEEQGEQPPGHEPADFGRDTTARYINLTAYSHFEGPDGLPAIKPPWGTLNAIDLNSGEVLWKVPLGIHPKAKDKQTGTVSWGGPVVTAGGLVFIGGTRDQKFRAFDKDTGKLLWETTLPTGGFATPASYMIDGRQYVVIAAGGGRGTRPGDYYIAFALPE